MNDEAIKLRPAGTTYGVIHRLGLKYVPPARARPTFPIVATTAKVFWDEMFNIFDNYRQTANDQIEARRKILSLVEEYGPQIWGADRLNVVTYPFPQYPEYTKDLHWDDGSGTQQFIKNQAISLFVDRVQKRDLTARKRRASLSMGNAPKRGRHKHPIVRFESDSDAISDDVAVDDLGDMSSLTELSEFSDDELVPYTMKMPRPILAVKGSLQRRKKKRRSPYSLIVTLKYMECERPDRKEVPCDQILPHCCIRSYSCLDTRSEWDKRPPVECRHPRVELKKPSLLSPMLISTSTPLALPVETIICSSIPPAPRLDKSDFRPGTEPKISNQPSLALTLAEQNDPASKRALNLSLFPCQTCREKKVECSREKPLCSTCANLRRECTYPRHGSAFSAEKDQSVIENGALRTHPIHPIAPPLEKPLEKNHTVNKDWMFSRLERTILHIRVGDAWDKIMSIELGSSRYVGDFFEKVSRHLAVGTIENLSLLLPCNIGKLEKYVVHIEAGKQETFLVLLDILQKAIMKLGTTRSVRYVLTGTVTVTNT